MIDTYDLLTRGVANIIPSKDLLKEELESGKKLNVYLGIDPTGLNIHLGHMVLIRKLKALYELGHNVTFLIGDFTALIGDTSDKESERPQITSEEVRENVESYKGLIKRIFDLEKEKINIRYNSEWLSKLNFEDILKLTQQFTLGDFISRELIKKRLQDGKKVGLHEVLYPVMQGKDSLELKTDLQIGGTDQTFNMQAGRTLIKNAEHRESFVLTMNFLTGTDGRKMSKTWNNAIWVRDNAETMYGKVMSLKDELITEYFLLATNVSLEEIKEIEKNVKSSPMEEKKKLAFIITSEFHGEQEARKAQAEFEKIVQNKELPEDIESLIVKEGEPLSKFIIDKGLVSSMSDWKRLIEQHGVSFNDKKIDNPFITTKELDNEGVLKIGKRIFVRISKS